MCDEAYDLGYAHGKCGTFLADRNNPYEENTKEFDVWESSYVDGFSDGEHEGLIEEE